MNKTDKKNITDRIINEVIDPLLSYPIEGRLQNNLILLITGILDAPDNLDNKNLDNKSLDNPKGDKTEGNLPNNTPQSYTNWDHSLADDYMDDCLPYIESDEEGFYF